MRLKLCDVTILLLLVLMSTSVLACDELVSENSTGLLHVTGDPGCDAFVTSLTRTTCKVGGDAYETAYVITVTSNETCDDRALNHTVRTCRGECGPEGVYHATNLTLTCTADQTTCTFVSRAVDCPAVSGDWSNITTCQDSDYWERSRTCTDCDGQVLDGSSCFGDNHLKTLCPEAYYGEWNVTSSCRFNGSSCKAEQKSERVCSAAALSEQPGACSDEQLVRVEQCELSFNCCACASKLECPLCPESYFPEDEEMSGSGDSSGSGEEWVLDSTAAPSQPQRQGGVPDTREVSAKRDDSTKPGTIVAAVIPSVFGVSLITYSTFYYAKRNSKKGKVQPGV